MNVALWAEIRRLAEIEKHSGRVIARRLHCSRHTVAAALELAQPPTPEPTRRDSLLDPYLEQIQEQLRTILQHYPGIQSEVVTFLGDRISESLSGETAQVAIKIFGDDLDALDKTADKVTAALGKVNGIVDLQFKRHVVKAYPVTDKIYQGV